MQDYDKSLNGFIEKAVLHPGYALVKAEENNKVGELITTNRDQFRFGEVLMTGGPAEGQEVETLEPVKGNAILFRTYGNDDCEAFGEKLCLIPFEQVEAIINLE